MNEFYEKKCARLMKYSKGALVEYMVRTDLPVYFHLLDQVEKLAAARAFEKDLKRVIQKKRITMYEYKALQRRARKLGGEFELPEFEK